MSTMIYDLLFPDFTELPHLPPFTASGYTAPASIGEANPSPPPATVSYVFLFSNIDGTVSTNPSPADGAQNARFWYEKEGEGPGKPAVVVWGFDAAQNVLVPIKFTVSSVPNVPDSVGSGGGILTGGIAAGNNGSVTAPDYDGLAQQPGVGEASFQYWLSLTTGKAYDKKTLPLGQNENDTFLAVYIPVFSPWHIPPNITNPVIIYGPGGKVTIGYGIGGPPTQIGNPFGPAGKTVSGSGTRKG